MYILMKKRKQNKNSYRFRGMFLNQVRNTNQLGAQMRIKLADCLMGWFYNRATLRDCLKKYCYEKT